MGVPTPRNPDPGILPSRVEVFLRILVVVVAIAAFATMFAIGISQTWTAPRGNVPEYGKTFVYLATTLAGLIGSVVAIGLGQKPPAQPQQNAKARLTMNLANLGKFMVPSKPDWHKTFAGLYAVVYFIWGLAAVVAWAVRTPETPALVKNLATTFIGIALPIIPAFFRQDT